MGGWVDGIDTDIDNGHTLSYDHCPSFLASVAGTVPWRVIAKTESCLDDGCSRGLLKDSGVLRLCAATTAAVVDIGASVVVGDA